MVGLSANEVRLGGILWDLTNASDIFLAQSLQCKHDILKVGGISTVVLTNQVKRRADINGGSKTIARWGLPMDV